MISFLLQKYAIKHIEYNFVNNPIRDEYFKSHFR